MKSFLRIVLVWSLASLLLACDSNQGSGQGSGPGPGKGPAATEPVVVNPPPAAVETDGPFPEAGKVEIDVTPGSISIRANQVDEHEILDSIAAAAGFRLLTGDVAWKTVSVDIRENTLHAALVELIKAYPYQIVYTPDTDSQQEVLSEVVISGTQISESPARTGGPVAEDEALLDRMVDEPDPDQQQALKKLQSTNPEVRAAAAGQVEPVGDALYTLTDLMVSDPAPEVRIASIQALEFSEDPLAIQALATCLKDEDVYVLIECITMLENMGDETTIARLRPLLSHYDLSVRNAAAQAIENLQ